jgi:hypothetical protein
LDEERLGGNYGKVLIGRSGGGIAHGDRGASGMGHGARTDHGHRCREKRWAIRHFVGQRVRDYRQAQMQAQIELDSAALPAVAEQAGIAAETAIVIS